MSVQPLPIPLPISLPSSSSAVEVEPMMDSLELDAQFRVLALHGDIATMLQLESGDLIDRQLPADILVPVLDGNTALRLRTRDGEVRWFECRLERDRWGAELFLSEIGGSPRRHEQERSPFGIAELMQLAGTCRRSTTLHVYVGHDPVGLVRMVEGEPWCAIDDQGVGFGALARLVAQPNAHVLALAPSVREQPVDRSLSGGAEALLLEAFRQMDEAQQAA